jgi:hypothetical protein
MTGASPRRTAEPRRKAFAKLTERQRKLSFEEWAVRTTSKFAEPTKWRRRAHPVEYASTAPSHAKAKCDC